ncbi:MAG: hypothetical protein H6Q73_4058 [Firmicutes bacterium]|nr:hypothetical protein [Bacillota bacterium]
MTITSTNKNNSQVSYQQFNQTAKPPQLTKAEKEKIEAAAKKAGVKIQPGQKPSDADIEKIKKAGGFNIDIKA